MCEAIKTSRITVSRSDKAIPFVRDEVIGIRTEIAFLIDYANSDIAQLFRVLVLISPEKFQVMGLTGSADGLGGSFLAISIVRNDLDFAFLHRKELCRPFTKKYADPDAPYDGYEESDDTEEAARTVRPAKKERKK